MANSNRRNVKAKYRLSQIRKEMVNAKNVSGANVAQQVIKSAAHVGVGGFIIQRGVVVQVLGMARKGRNTTLKTTAIYSVKKGRVVTPKPKHFMEKASLTTAAKMNEFYIQEAERQLAKLR